ncbi:Phage Tail Collar Domain [Variovorax sp. OK605]|jgi:phage-related tail fiber protein|uniref:phage tail protein n=1 Tax=Variovorax sp. OK605 TaxID=1855317 RepID=UPI0008F3C0A5|nr:phage tail protein [Variovorax sp. OK605]SFP44003.1 Phage Tail Collar Domain [Variovorax sp. OK605]
MAVVFENRVIEACVTLGTGNLVTSGADLGYFTFAEKVPVGSTVHYLCESVNAVGRPTGEFELGRGTYVAANTISRDTVVASSNAGAVVNFAQANKRVSLTVLAPTTPVVRTDWREVIGAQVEPGVVGYTAASVPPSGWLKRNGAAVSRTIYAALFQAIGIDYGAGNGATTFNLPEARGEFDRGWDEGRGIDPGRIRGTKQPDALQGHVHDNSMSISTIVGGDNQGYTVGSIYTSNAASQRGALAIPGTHASYTPVRVAAETRPSNVAYLPIIKF